MSITSTRTRVLRSVLVGGAALAFTLGATGCQAIEGIQKSTSDAYAITYEVSVTGGDTKTIKDVSYLDSDERGGDSVEKTSASEQTTADAKNKATSVWTKEAMITAEKNAAVSATPGKGATASCKILIDGVKEISAVTGKPGESVDCSAATPAFPKKK